MTDDHAVLLAFVIMFTAATPGVMESYLTWHQYPESRPFIIGWYVALGIVAAMAATTLKRFV